MIKQWRVGTVSMGSTLLLLGVVLLITQWQGLQAFDAMLRWWPVVLILLGLEILFFLAVKGRERPLVFYDVFSILFVGVLICGALGFTLLTSVGILGEIRYKVSAVERSFTLPDLARQVPQDVKKIIVQTNGQEVNIDKTPQREIHLLGSYRIEAPSQTEETSADANAAGFASTQTIGDTMYVILGGLPNRKGLLQRYYPQANVTLVLPADVQIEVRNRGSEPIPHKA